MIAYIKLYFFYTQHFMVKTKLSGSGSRRFSFELMMVPYLIVVIAVLAIGGELWVMRSRAHRAIVPDTYQAVFLTNGQVYFGKLQSLNRSYMTLADVYYLQESTTDDSSSTASSKNTNANTNTQSADTQFKIIRLGEEIHQPQNGMVISRDQILYWENLATSSRIIDAIGQEKEQSATE